MQVPTAAAAHCNSASVVMFQSIINRATHSVESAVTSIALRAAVAIPFLVALGFGTAAAGVQLVQTYGHVQAYAIMAAAFAVVGIVGMVATRPINVTKPADAHAPLEEGNSAPNIDSSSMITPDFLISALGVVGPKAIPAIPALLRFIVKNWALVLSVAIVAALLMSEQSKTTRSRPIDAS